MNMSMNVDTVFRRENIFQRRFIEFVPKIDKFNSEKDRMCDAKENRTIILEEKWM